MEPVYDHRRSGDVAPMMRRREMLASAAAAIAAAPLRAQIGAASQHSYDPPIPPADRMPSLRPAPSQRRYRSPAVEREIDRVVAGIADPKLRWLFGNCY